MGKKLCSISFMGDISEDFWISRKKHKKKETLMALFLVIYNEMVKHHKVQLAFRNRASLYDRL